MGLEDRLKKQIALREANIDPYPYSYPVDSHTQDILKQYDGLQEKTTKVHHLAGRLRLIRRMGKATFMHLQDQSGMIQIYLTRDTTQNYSLLKKLDLGDIIGVHGPIFRTQKGELTVEVQSYTVLCKALRDLPEKFHGLKDPELRYRKRYLDLIMNSEVKDAFITRTKIIKAVRKFMDKEGFLEVETPVLQTVYGGAEARPFSTHINAWNMDMYLSISPELYLKRLLVGGFEKVYTICKNFRNEGVDRTHNPEFSMMEFYQSYVDYTEMMRLTEDIYAFVAKEVTGSTVIEYDGTKIDLKAPWERLTVVDALKKYAKIDVTKLSDALLQKLVKEHKVDVKKFTRGWAIAGLFEALCEDKLIQPVFITDYPKEMSPLCKAKRGNEDFIEKVEPYINGWEMGNGYSELNDPVIQRQLLTAQGEQQRAGAQEAHPHDEDFIQAIEHGMPPAGGMGLGIDRMIMLIAGQKSLRDVILFPTMKPDQ